MRRCIAEGVAALPMIVFLVASPAAAQDEPGTDEGQPVSPQAEDGNRPSPPVPEPLPPEESAGDSFGAGIGPEEAPTPPQETPVERDEDTGAPATGEARTPVADDVPELEEPEERTSHHFGFGSYGRLGVGTDFHGATPQQPQVTAHGPRTVQSPYLELDLYYTIDPVGPYLVRTVTTLGFTDDLFHYTGDWSAMLALRNVYAEFTYRDMLSIWVGSRSYRGDDIYLLDFWPLDNLNAVGGGIGFRRDRLEIAWHIGVNRLTDELTYQEADVPDRLFGAERIVLMDRQRLVTSLGGSYRLWGPPGGPAIKLKVYLELHYLASGTMRREEDNTTEHLPSDWGWTGGLQLGSWGWGERDSHANLFLRFSQGLAAYGEMGIPFGVDEEKRTFPGASELVVGLSVNYERGRFGILGAGYVRRFTDADPNIYDEDDYWELVLDVRPWIVVFGPIQLALDLSYQQRFPYGMSPSALELLDPGILQVAPMIVFAPLGPGSYVRPQIRLVYRMAYLNEGALDTYAFEDPRRYDEVTHYVGLQVEWWYNSSYR